MIIAINHEWLCTYPKVVQGSTHYLRLSPPNSLRQRVLEWTVDLPSPAFVSQDSFGNKIHLLSLDMPHQQLSVRVSGLVELSDYRESSLTDAAAFFYLKTTSATLWLSPPAALLQLLQKQNVLVGLEQLVTVIHSSLTCIYRAIARASLAEVYASGRATPQELVHVFLACCRHAGLPARCVSGYWCAQHFAQERHHVWAEVLVGECWYGFDVVNGTRVNDGYVTLAVGLDYVDVQPVRGLPLDGFASVEHQQASIHMQHQMRLPHTSDSLAAQQQQQ